ncbi:MAG: HutD family protein [Pseudomonadota bacterium]|nr:HutD family protein [Pseudomonadota bacterium]
MSLIRFREIDATPWKNGRGLTWEIAVDATPVDDNPFRWRLSRARITQTCTFSAYPGVRRWLALATGGALEMRVDARPPHTLERPGNWMAFDGGAGVESVPLEGPVEDFNLMLADPQLDAEMLHRPLIGTMVLAPEARAITVFHLLDGQAQLQGDKSVRIAPADTVLIRGDQPGAKIQRVVGSGEALIVRIFPRDADTTQA